MAVPSIRFIGDALVIFSATETKGTVEDARACLNMATEMQRRLAELNVKWRRAGTEQPFRVRMGVNTGFCNVGNFGSVDRMDYTAIGAEVNLAARLNRSPSLDTSSSATRPTLSCATSWQRARVATQISVKGISRMVVPYVVEGVLDEAGRKIEISASMTGLDFYLDPRPSTPPRWRIRGRSKCDRRPDGRGVKGARAGSGAIGSKSSPSGASGSGLKRRALTVGQSRQQAWLFVWEG